MCGKFYKILFNREHFLCSFFIKNFTNNTKCIIMYKEKGGIMDYLEKIKQFGKININAICKDLKINRSNLYNGKTTKENEKKVYEKLVEKVKKVID